MSDELLTKAEHLEFARRMEDEESRQNRRLELLESAQRETRQLVISVEKMALSVESMAKELEHQGQRLDRIEAEPGDNWKRAVWIVVTALISAALGYFLR